MQHLFGSSNKAISSFAASSTSTHDGALSPIAGKASLTLSYIAKQNVFLFGGGKKKTSASFSIAPSQCMSAEPDRPEAWIEVCTEQVKKRKKLFFFADRVIKLYENGYLGYYSNRGNLKALIDPLDIRSVALEASGGTKDRLKVVTRTKTYLFKLPSCEAAREWHARLNKPA